VVDQASAIVIKLESDELRARLQEQFKIVREMQQPLRRILEERNAR